MLMDVQPFSQHASADDLPDVCTGVLRSDACLRACAEIRIVGKESSLVTNKQG